jgi:hypothetical protein
VEEKTHTIFLFGNLSRRGHVGDLDVDGRITVAWILEKSGVNLDSVHSECSSVTRLRTFVFVTSKQSLDQLSNCKVSKEEGTPWAYDGLVNKLLRQLFTAGKLSKVVSNKKLLRSAVSSPSYGSETMLSAQY